MINLKYLSMVLFVLLNLSNYALGALENNCKSICLKHKNQKSCEQSCGYFFDKQCVPMNLDQKECDKVCKLQIELIPEIPQLVNNCSSACSSSSDKKGCKKTCDTCYAKNCSDVNIGQEKCDEICLLKGSNSQASVVNNCPSMCHAIYESKEKKSTSNSVTEDATKNLVTSITSPVNPKKVCEKICNSCYVKLCKKNKVTQKECDKSCAPEKPLSKNDCPSICLNSKKPKKCKRKCLKCYAKECAGLNQKECDQKCDKRGADLKTDGFRLTWVNDKLKVSVWYLDKTYKVDKERGDTALSPGFKHYDANTTGWHAKSYHVNRRGKVKMLWSEDSTDRICVWQFNAFGEILNMNSINSATSKDKINSESVPSKSKEGRTCGTETEAGFLFYNSGAKNWRAIGNHLFNDGTSQILWQNNSTKNMAIWYLGSDGDIDSSKGDKGFKMIDIDPKHVKGWTLISFNVTPTATKMLWSHDKSSKASLWSFDDSWKKENMSFETYEGSKGFKIAACHFNYNGSLDLVWERKATGDAELWHLIEPGIKGHKVYPYNHGNKDKSWSVVDFSAEPSLKLSPPATVTNSSNIGDQFNSAMKKDIGNIGNIGKQFDAAIKKDKSK